MYQYKNYYEIIEKQNNTVIEYGISITTVLQNPDKSEEVHKATVHNVTSSYSTILYIKDLLEENNVQWIHLKDILQDLM